MSSPTLDLPGAVPAPEDSVDRGVPWHFGDPFAEQRSAARSAVLVDRSHREVIAVPGEERLSWLHLVLSQHLTELPEGQGTEALVLDTHGRVDSHVLVAHHEGVVYLDTDAPSEVTSALPTIGVNGRQSLPDYLEAMRFWSKVEPRDATSEFAVLTAMGPDAGGILAGFTEVPSDAYEVRGLPGGGFVRNVPFRSLQTYDLLVPRESLVDWWLKLTDAGIRPSGTMAFEALRVEALRPRVGMDTDERAIPHELGWIHLAAHVAKGCYRGQETVAKVHNVGKPPRRMVLLHLDGSVEVSPEIGDPVFHGDRKVGRVGSVVQHHELGPVALALLKRTAPVDGELMAGDPEEDRAVAAAVDPDSVPPDSGEPPGRVAADRLRGR
ncbi:CAF17-like 4Fe-4S cluster assembly/insertion protein YgfZ [Saccharopolyspora endophytica]|uniref:Folate-binding protein YgfZ n=1 Tax=Saccharopolyspora endophytica TaxID=543886 RepID=A0ABS5D8I4_9PSEU|nr:folate-binding protein YgfZ [Saccharopolyspora endophytica]MBQ0922606.1 folate-binding protein YgfZ [Saccharopolyspora endophytica]